ncbi:MinD/ParA family protein [Arthrobacter sp. FW305-BF8]|uniref:MinD/ParA family ATP-binding protein n=1 Tax=Arthrobacter sp. FW305-BF8 TaxID=2879617 RepID=UPI001F21562E|nr:MinD/ParA family protein [Arthrobacter sp. FW305-BF8]UKA55988.1 MinD/ParA family protein [Arthrobacter sp. FW305-BF8]
MTQTNTPKPGPRPDRRPSISQGSVVDLAAEPVTGPGGVSPADAADLADVALTSDVASAGDISVVTVSDAQDRTSAGSLPAVGGVVQRGTVTSAMPVVTAGPGGAIAEHKDLADAPAPVEPLPAPVDEGEESKDLPGRRERPEGPESAAALTADRLLTRAAAAPVSGWRRWLYQATLGYVNLGDSDQVRIQRAMEHRIAMRLGERTRYVPVLSRKGGVGKTTVTTLLGMVLAELREDRVIAMDANPDRGTLSDRSPGRADFTARQLVKDRFTVDSFAQLSNYTARDGSRLDVLASDTDPMVAHAFDDADYRAVTDILGRYYSIVLTDSGTGMVHSVMKGTLEKADAVVLVSGGSVDEARLASETLSWLEAHGRQDLVAKATVVINMAAGNRTLVNINEIEQHFLSRVKNVVRIPHDRHLAEGSRIRLGQLKPATRAAAVELAALVVDELQQA